MANTKISALTSATTPLAGTEVLPIVQSSATVKVSAANLTAGRDVALKTVTATAAATQDGVALAGRAGGTSSYIATITPTTLSASCTVTLPNANTSIPVATQTLTFSGPTAARTITLPDANFTAARTDAAQSFTGDQTLSTGNLVIGTSGKGIDFSATAGSGTSELLADYEEGTWTPTITPSTSGAVTYTTQSGTYTKVGRQVVIVFIVAGTKNTASGEFRVGGIPFNISGSAITGAINWYNPSGTALVNAVAFYFSSTLFRIGVITAANTDATAATFSSAEVSSTFSLTGTLTYFV